LNGNKRKINWKRKLFHLFTSLALFLLYFFLEKREFFYLLFLGFILFTLFEFLRLKRKELLPFKGLWEPLLKEKERNSLSDAFYFLFGLLLSLLIAPYELFGITILILGMADPLAEISGKLLKGKEIFRGKTLEGGLGFFLSSLLLQYLYFGEHKSLHLLHALFLSLVELLSERDNLWIPLVSGIFLRVFFS